jgi:hypothetical protein
LGIINLTNIIYYAYKPIQKEIEKDKISCISIEESIESNDILLNILALVERRVGKKRILNMSEKMKLKHLKVQIFMNFGLVRYESK